MQGLENVKQVARGHFFGWRLSGSHPCFGDWHAQFHWQIAGFQGHPLPGQRDWPFLLNPWLKQSSWWERYVWRPLQDEACCAQSWMFLKQVFDLEGAPRKDSILSLWAHFSTRSNCGKRCEVDGIMIAFAWLRSQRVPENGIFGFLQSRDYWLARPNEDGGQRCLASMDSDLEVQLGWEEHNIILCSLLEAWHCVLSHRKQYWQHERAFCCTSSCFASCSCCKYWAFIPHGQKTAETLQDVAGRSSRRSQCIMGVEWQ